MADMTMGEALEHLDDYGIADPLESARTVSSSLFMLFDLCMAAYDSEWDVRAETLAAMADHIFAGACMILALADALEHPADAGERWAPAT